MILVKDKHNLAVLLLHSCRNFFNKKSYYVQFVLGGITLISTALLILIATGINFQYENNGSKFSYNGAPILKSLITVATTVSGGGGLAGIVLAMRGKKQVEEEVNLHIQQ